MKKEVLNSLISGEIIEAKQPLKIIKINRLDGEVFKISLTDDFYTHDCKFF